MSAIVGDDSTHAVSIAADHPSLAGHFPGNPIVPGVVLLDEAIAAIERGRGEPLRAYRLASVKFLRAVRPPATLSIRHRNARSGIDFTVGDGDGEHIVASGRIELAAAPDATVPRPAWTSTPERGTASMLRLMTWLSLALGRTLTRPIVHGISLYFLAFAPRARRASRAYLRRALGRKPTPVDLYRHIVAFATSIHDRLYLLNERFDLFDIGIEGEDRVTDARDQGRGAFLMGAHMGSFELIHALGRRQPGVRGAMVMYEDNARRINALMAAINPAAQQDIIPLGRIDSMLLVRGALDDGVFVGVLGDRSFSDDVTVPVPFLGDVAWLPSSPFRMAAVLRRRVIFMVGLWLGGNRYRVRFVPLADFSATTREERDAAVVDAMHRYAALLEQHCREAPYNWFNFFDFWQAPESAAPGASGSSRCGP